MSSNRRLNLRKNKKSDKDSNQSISNFVQRRSKDDAEVEIVVDDDDVQEVGDQYEFTEEPVLRPLKRRKKQIVIKENNEDKNESDLDELEGMEDMDETEKQQMKEALRQSRLEMEEEAKRRDIYDKFLQSTNSKAGAADIPSTSQATSDLPSSPVSSSTGTLHQQRAESPDLFGTPQPSYDQDKKCDGTPDSHVSDKTNSPFKKEISIQLSPIKTHRIASKTTTKTTVDHDQDNLDNNNTTTSERKEQRDKVTRSLKSKKRKHMIDDSDDESYDGSKETIKEPIAVESKKKQKTIENFAVSTSSNVKKEQETEIEKKQFVIDDDEELHDGSESDNRSTSVRKHKKSFKVSLQRTYKKPKLVIKTIRDAMKARLLFAPPGIDNKLYTYSIIRILDHSKDCIRKAQKKCSKFVEWGLPIVAGQRIGDTLDAKKDRKTHVAKESFTDTVPELKTRRSLRSAQSKTNNEPTIKTDSDHNVEVKTEKDPADILTDKKNNVQSDDSDDELTKPVFGYTLKNAKNWQEYNSMSKTRVFGENIVTSGTLHVNKDDENNKTKDTNKGGKAFNNISKNKVNRGDKSNTETKEDSNQQFEHIPKGKINVNKDGKMDLNQRSKNASNDSNNTSKKQKPGVDDFKANTRDASQDSDNLDPTKVYVKTESITKTYRKQGTSDENSKTLQDDNKGTGIDSSTVGSPSKRKRNSPAKRLGKQDFSSDNDTDGIDSSAEITRTKPKRLSRKAPLIEEQDNEEDSDENIDVDIEMVDIDDSSPIESTSRKPGETLSNLAAKSGFLKVNRHDVEAPKVQRKVSKAARRAAEAAEKRMREETATSSSSATESTSTMEPCIASRPSQENQIQCPMCYAQFPLEDIETHAATCNGTPPESSQADYNSGRGMSDQQDQQSSTLADPKTVQAQEYGLRGLHVVVTRSPVAQRKLAELKNNETFKARRNLSLTKRDKHETQRRTTDVVDMTTDDDEDNTPKDDSLENRDDSQGPPRNSTWLASESQEMKRKEKFKVTYGGKKKTGTRTNPFSTLDFIPLQNHQPSSDSETEATTGRLQGNQKYQTDGVQATPITSSEKGSTHCDDHIDIDSASDSDTDNGEKKKNVKNINEVLGPKKQDGNSKKKRKGPRDDFDEDDCANERALLELAGISEKSPSPDYQPVRKRPCGENQSKASKRRRKRATISSESDDNDDTEKCFVCDKRILKDVYKEHTEVCIESRPLSAVTPKRTRVDDTSSRSAARNPKPSARPGSSNTSTVEMDPDEIGDSPIKSFKLIGEVDNSAVDFDNQFAFYNNKNTHSSSNRGSRNSRGRGRGKSRFKKKSWRKNKN